MMNVVVLLSCMHQNDVNIIQRSNIQTDVVVINQTDIDTVEEFDFMNRKGRRCHALFISTTERGLSRSRNLAIASAEKADICVISDDDESFADDYEDVIIQTYLKHPYADFISFACIRKNHTYPQKWLKMNVVRILKTSSIQITFKRESIIKNNISFDVLMGSGTGNGSGEENKFMMDCRHCGLDMFYDPSIITTLISTNSFWMNGYNKTYFKNRGWASRRILGALLGYLFVWYNIISHCKEFVSNDYSLFSVIKYFHIGFFEKR